MDRLEAMMFPMGKVESLLCEIFQPPIFTLETRVLIRDLLFSHHECLDMEFLTLETPFLEIAAGSSLEIFLRSLRQTALRVLVESSPRTGDFVDKIIMEVLYRHQYHLEAV